MSDHPTTPEVSATGALARLADEVLPALIARLDASGLGELEVRHDGWRVRLRRDLTPMQAPAAAIGAAAPASGHDATPAREPVRSGAMSPAVGYFIPNEKTPVGRKVAAGDVLGWVEVLGVRQEVVSPRDGTVGRLSAEAGQAVEYGQELVVVDGPRSRVTEQPGVAGAVGGAGARGAD